MRQLLPISEGVADWVAGWRCGARSRTGCGTKRALEHHGRATLRGRERLWQAGCNYLGKY